MSVARNYLRMLLAMWMRRVDQMLMPPDALLKISRALSVITSRKSFLENIDHFVPGLRVPHCLVVSHPRFHALIAAQLTVFKLLNVAKSGIDDLFKVRIIKIDVVTVLV